MRVLLRLLVLCLGLASLPTVAQTLATLHQVREPVASQQPQERDAALQRALDVLIVRLTGDPEAPANPALAALRSDPQQLIRTYGYEGGEEQVLLVEFDPAGTDRALRQAGLALWGSNRPTLLTWWLNEGPTDTSLVGDGQPAAARLRSAGDYRGLPLRLPLADLQEQLLVTPEALKQPNLEELQSASGRYGADALLLVHAREQDDGTWQASWRLNRGAEQEQGSATAQEPAGLADQVMLAVAGRLAAPFLVRSGSAETLTLIIHGSNLSRYGELQQLLAGFDARLLQVEGDRVSYQLKAGVEQLRAQLGLLQLQEMPAEATPPEAGSVTGESATVLQFRW